MAFFFVCVSKSKVILLYSRAKAEPKSSNEKTMGKGATERDLGSLYLPSLTLSFIVLSFDLSANKRKTPPKTNKQPAATRESRNLPSVEHLWIATLTNRPFLLGPLINAKANALTAHGKHDSFKGIVLIKTKKQTKEKQNVLRNDDQNRGHWKKKVFSEVETGLTHKGERRPFLPWDAHASSRFFPSL